MRREGAFLRVHGSGICLSSPTATGRGVLNCKYKIDNNWKTFGQSITALLISTQNRTGPLSYVWILTKSHNHNKKTDKTQKSSPDSPCKIVLKFLEIHARQFWIFSAFYSPLRTGFILSSFLSVSSIGPLGKFLTLSWCSSVALNFFLNSER